MSRAPVNPRAGSKVARVRSFRFPGGHGRTWIESYSGQRYLRHISIWFGQSPKDVDAYKKPRYTLSIDLYKEPPKK